MRDVDQCVEDMESWAMDCTYIMYTCNSCARVMSVCNVHTVQVHDKASDIDQIIPAWSLFMLITCTGADRRHVTELGSHPP